MKLIPVSEERLLLERGYSLEWAIDRERRKIAQREKERLEIIEHCVRNGIFKADEYALVSRPTSNEVGQDYYFVRRTEEADGEPSGE